MSLYEQVSAIAYLVMGLFVGVAGAIVAAKMLQENRRPRGRRCSGPDE